MRGQDGGTGDDPHGLDGGEQLEAATHMQREQARLFLLVAGHDAAPPILRAGPLRGFAQTPAARLGVQIRQIGKPDVPVIQVSMPSSLDAAFPFEFGRAHPTPDRFPCCPCRLA